MTIYIRPYGDDKNDGSEKAPVKSPKRAIAIANRNNDNEINLLSTDWARINGELDAEELHQLGSRNHSGASQGVHIGQVR